MAVPDTTDFTLQDVTTEIFGDTAAGRSLTSCFASAVSSGFDSLYSGAKDRLSNFRNYGVWSINSIDSTHNATKDITAFRGGSSEAAGSIVWIDEQGTRAFMLRYSDKKIAQYSLSNAHDINSTWTYVGVSPQLLFYVADFRVSPDGSKVYVRDLHNIYQLTMSSVWAISTLSTSLANYVTFPLTSTNSNNFVFRRDGLMLYGNMYKTVNSVTGIHYTAQWDLTTAWDITTASPNAESSIESHMSTLGDMCHIGNGRTLISDSSSIPLVLFEGGVLSVNYVENRTEPSLQFTDSNNNAYIYATERSVSSPYVHTLKQYKTNQ